VASIASSRSAGLLGCRPPWRDFPGCAIIPFSAFAVYALKGEVERKMTSGHRIFALRISEFEQPLP
jgi:hypothetical protein